jgi:type II secretory pathway pseudopilin PulG
MSAEGRIDAARGRVTTRISRRLRQQAGFTLIEVLLAGVMLAIVSVPISALLSGTAAIARLDRQRTSADQLAQKQIETLRALPYFNVGLVGGNPQGTIVSPTTATLPSIGSATVTTKVTYVSDPLPSNPYPTKADYKKVVVTVSNTVTGNVLSTKTTYIAPASAPPNAGSTWIQIQRTVVDAVTNLAIPGATVNLTGGPDVNPVTNRTDTTDPSGTVLFPGLSTTSGGTPGYTILTTPLTGYSMYPDDLAPAPVTAVASTVGNNSTATVRMYKQGISLTVTVQTSAGAAFTSGATVSLDSSRCGVQTVSIPSGQSSATFTTCNYATGASYSVPLVPNVLGQVPLFDKYYVTAWSTAGTCSGGCWSAGTPVTVPSNYPTTLTQSLNVKFSSTTYSTTKVINVTVKKGGSADANARVELTGGPPGVYLYATTNGSGVASFTVPVSATGFTFTANAMDTSLAKGSATTASITTSTTSPIALTDNIS